MSKTRAEKLAERKSHLPVAPTPESAQILTADAQVSIITGEPHVGDAPGREPSLVEQIKDALPKGFPNLINAATGKTLTMEDIESSDTESVNSGDTIVVGFDPAFGEDLAVSAVVRDGIITDVKTHLGPEAHFTLFIRSPKGLDLTDARVRDVFDMTDRIKQAYLAGWEAARA